MTQNNSDSAAPTLSKAAVILAYVIASIGFAFDIYELLMLPLIFRYACRELGGMMGRVVLAVFAVIIVSRRGLIRFFVVPGMVVGPYVF